MINNGSCQGYIQHRVNLLLQEIKPDLERELMVRKLGWPSRACHKGTKAHNLFEETMETRA